MKYSISCAIIFDFVKIILTKLKIRFSFNDRCTVKKKEQDN